MKKNIFQRKIKKILMLFFIAILISTNITFGFNNNNILYVKYKYTPILNSLDHNSKLVGYLNQGYIVIGNGEFGDYTKVKLTDNKNGYVLKNNLGDFNNNPFEVGGNYGKLEIKKTLYTKTFLNSEKIGDLEIGTEVFILHVNYINNDWVKIKVNSGKFKNKIGYILKKNIELSIINNFKNDIQRFIENNGENNNISTGLLIKKDKINNSSKNIVNKTPKSSYNSSKNKNDDDVNSLINSLNDVINKTPGNSSYNPSTSKNDDDINSLINSLNDVINKTPGNSSSNSSTSKNDDVNSLINSLNDVINKTPGNSSSNSSTSKNDDVNSLINSLNDVINKY